MRKILIASCFALLSVACTKEVKVPLTNFDEQNADPAFLSSLKPFTYAEYVSPDSNAIESYTKESLNKLNDTLFIALQEIYSPDSVETESDFVYYRYKDGILTQDGYPMWFKGASAGQTKKVQDFYIRCAKKDTSVSSLVGTFTCDKFLVSSDSSFVNNYDILLVPKGLPYPFIKFGEKAPQKEVYRFEMTSK